MCSLQRSICLIKLSRLFALAPICFKYSPCLFIKPTGILLQALSKNTPRRVQLAFSFPSGPMPLDLALLGYHRPQDAYYYLWVGGIPPGWTKEQLMDYFSLYGIVRDCHLNVAHGSSGDLWAKVAYGWVHEAKWAIDWAHGLDILWPLTGNAKKHKLKVNFFDWTKATDEDWEYQAPEDQAQQIYLFRSFGITPGAQARQEGKIRKALDLPQYVIEDPLGRASKGQGKGWAAQQDILLNGQCHSAPDHSATRDILHWSQPGFINLMNGEGSKHSLAREAWEVHLESLLQQERLAPW